MRVSGGIEDDFLEWPRLAQLLMNDGEEFMRQVNVQRAEVGEERSVV